MRICLKLYVHCLSKPSNNLNEQEMEQVEGKNRREEEPPDGLGKQNRGGEWSLLQRVLRQWHFCSNIYTL